MSRRRPPDARQAHRPRAPGRPARRWGTWLVGAVSCAVLASGGLGWAVVDHVSSGLDRVDAFTTSDRPGGDDGLNFLLVGVDRRTGLSAHDRRRLKAGGTACNCTDTLMLLHISRNRERASVVSIPRDSYVELPPPREGAEEPAGTDGKPPARAERQDARHFGKINAAYSRGGPAMTVQAVERATGLRIDHYLEVNFRSFMRTVDSLGGVPVCTMAELHDSYSGLDLPRGTSLLDGEGALKYVRARHVGSRSDFGRIERQQHFLAQIIKRLHSSGVLMNPARLTSAVDTVLGSVRADRGLRPSDLVALGTAMRDLTPSGSEFTSVPVADPDYQGDSRWGSTVLWDRARATRLFDRLRADLPLAVRRHKRKGRPVPIDPRTIRVDVVDASGRAGLADRAAERLAGTGFAVTGEPVRRGSRRLRRTVITYDPRWDRSAASLATALPGARLQEERGHGPVMRVEVGSRFTGVTKVRGRKAGLVEGPDGAVTGDQVLCT